MTTNYLLMTTELIVPVLSFWSRCRQRRRQRRVDLRQSGRPTGWGRRPPDLASRPGSRPVPSPPPRAARRQPLPGEHQVDYQDHDAWPIKRPDRRPPGDSGATASTDILRPHRDIIHRFPGPRIRRRRLRPVASSNCCCCCCCCCCTMMISVDVASAQTHVMLASRHISRPAYVCLSNLRSAASIARWRTDARPDTGAHSQRPARPQARRAVGRRRPAPLCALSLLAGLRSADDRNATAAQRHLANARRCTHLHCWRNGESATRRNNGQEVLHQSTWPSSTSLSRRSE